MAADAQLRTAEATGDGRPWARRDQTYKAFYELVGTLQVLLHGYMPEHIEGAEAWFKCFDFESAEFISTELTPRRIRTAGTSTFCGRCPSSKADCRALICTWWQCWNSSRGWFASWPCGCRARRRGFMSDCGRIGDPARHACTCRYWRSVYNGPERRNAPRHMRDLVRPGAVPNAEERPWEPGFMGDSDVVLDVGSCAGRDLPEGNIVSLMIRPGAFPLRVRKARRGRRRRACGSVGCANVSLETGVWAQGSSVP